MIIKETIINLDFDADYTVHPVIGPLYIWEPAIIKQLYNGQNCHFYTTKTRKLEPLVTGIIALNIVVAKAKGIKYPKKLIEKDLWDRSLINRAKRYLFTETGLEASLRSLNPSNFIYLRYKEPDPGDSGCGSLIRIVRTNTKLDTNIGCVVNVNNESN